MYRTGCLIVLLLVASTVRLFAQESAVRSGVQVRVASDLLTDNPSVGRVVEMSGGTLLLRVDSVDVRIDLATVARLDVNRGRGRRTQNALKGGAAGLMVGAIGGALIGPLLYSSDCRGSVVRPGDLGGCISDLVDGRARLEAAAGFGIAGVLLGSIFGAILTSDENWEEVSLDRLGLRFETHSGSIAFDVSVAFQF